MKKKDKATLEKVRVITLEKQEYEGVVMPNSTKKTLFLKLKNGYNIGINRDKISKTEKLKEDKKAIKKRKAKAKFNKNLPTISILHTGGTIASKVDYETGGVIASYKPEDLIEMFPEMTKIANLQCELISNIFSEDMLFKDYEIMAKTIQKHAKKGVDGIIIGHGTDTMHYTSAALSFILEDLPIPVLLVGAQRSSDRGSSDAAVNLIAATKFIAQTRFADVSICMHENMDDHTCLILPGTKARKLHSSRRDAFKAVNDDAIARINYKTGKVNFFREYKKKNKNKKLKLMPKMEEKVAIIKTYPNMDASQLLNYKNYKGLVIEGTGLGHAPINKGNEKIYNAIKILAENSIVVMTSQTVFGRVNMEVYSTGRKLLELGVISGQDMTTETAFIKLAWLLKNHPKNVENLFSKNLRGEINERLMPDHHIWWD